MKTKEKDSVKVVKDLTKELADAYLKAAMADAKSNGYKEVINKLRQQVSKLIFADDCSSGWCTPSGSTIQPMTDCECRIEYSGCAWKGKFGTQPGKWIGATVIFGDLCQILAESYAAHMTRGSKEDREKAANEQVIRALGHLITEANEKRAPDVGICSVALTKPPTVVRMTEEQSKTFPGMTWRPDPSKARNSRKRVNGLARVPALPQPNEHA